MSKILLVEDNEMNRDVLSRLLQKRGFTVILAEDGEAAVATALRELPDIILMDISLPVLDGYEATRLLRQAASLRDVPVIALTAHALSGDRQKALDAGCTDYETKPVEFARLLAKLEAYLGGGRP
jgi:CheY-like chemotaxis protein